MKINKPCNTDPEKLNKVEIKKIGLFSSDFNLQPYKEISHKRDIMEVWHWRVNTRRLIQDNYKFEPGSYTRTLGAIMKITLG